MKILHIGSDFAKQSIYNELVTHLELTSEARQSVYVPTRTAEELGRNTNPALRRTEYHFSHILRPYHRVFFRTKRRAVVNDMIARNLFDGVDVVHAHFLYSDGSVALEWKKRSQVPYIVTVRNTDINYFMKYRPDLNALRREILSHASAVTFLSPAYMDVMLAKLPTDAAVALRKKAHVVPNGVAEFWLAKASVRREVPKRPPRLLYVGDFSRNKNVRSVIHAAAILRKSYDLELTLVGGGGTGERDILAMLESGTFPFVAYRGRVHDVNELLSIYRNHDVFVMPSYRETFGVVYAEALSQGMPVVYSRGQGIDGYIDNDRIGAAIDPHNCDEIVAAITSLLELGISNSAECVRKAAQFNWPDIAAEYLRIYGRGINGCSG